MPRMPSKRIHLHKVTLAFQLLLVVPLLWRAEGLVARGGVEEGVTSMDFARVRISDDAELLVTVRVAVLDVLCDHVVVQVPLHSMQRVNGMAAAA